MVQEMNNAEIGSFKTLSLPVQFSKIPRQIQSFPPKLGEHTIEILEQLGLDKEDIERLINEGVVNSSNERILIK
ncbi:hypothetical protein WMZ97_06880 [Lentibacillus sp. N15]|uniref:hypothetical protein n=1 Tax=Lentibacillus songyuanensis TaxID=3136161 RepID=UPI0031BB2FD3